MGNRASRPSPSGKHGLDYYPVSLRALGVEDPGGFLHPSLPERRFRVRQGFTATAEQKEVETFFMLDRIKYFPLSPK